MLEVRILVVSATLILSGMLMLVENKGNVDDEKDGDPIIIDDIIDTKGIQYLRSSDTGFFTENLGQWDESISFVADTSFGKVGLGSEGIFFNIFDSDDVSCHIIGYFFEGGENREPGGIDPLPHVTNYFKGNDKDKWVTNARSYREVVYEDVWDGIDLRYYFAPEGLKYDMILKSGASPQDIQIRVEGHERISTDNASLTVQTDDHVLKDERLNVFYMDRPTEKIDSRFVQLSDDTFGFELSNYRTDRQVIIDPLIASTYFGGSGTDKGLAVDIDQWGNVIMAGCTESADFPIEIGSYDTSYAGSTDYFVSKFKGEDLSQLIFSTYIGGSNDDGYWDCFIDVVDDGILMTGTTRSSDFPTTDGCYDSSLDGYYDSFFLKLSSNGTNLIFSSYLGGSGSYDIARGIMGSSDGDFYVYGYTYSSDFPTTSDAYMSSMSGYGDGFISKFNGSSGDTMIYSTFIGGSSTYDCVYNLYEAPNKEMIITGYTSSLDFPTTSGSYSQTISGSTDCFVTRLKSDISGIVSSTFFGGSSTDKVYSVVLDEEENIVVVGYTYSSDFPITANVLRNEFSGYSEGYVTVFKSDLSDILASTFIGGNSSDTVNCVDIDAFGNIVIAGYTSSGDLNTTDDAEYRMHSGARDGFISILKKNLTGLEHSTFIGGSSDDLIMGGDLGLDPNGKAVFTGYTYSSDFPVLNNSYQSNLSGSSDSFLVAMDITPWLEPASIESISVYSDPEYMTQNDRFDVGQRVYVELRGVDANTSLRSGSRVNITYLSGSFPQRQLTLLETEKDSGIHRGSLFVNPLADYFDVIEITSWKDAAKKVKIIVDYPFRPFSISSLSVHTDPFNLSTLNRIDLGQKVCFKAVGLDANPNTIDKSFVNLSSDGNSTFKNPIVLIETDFNSGEYICYFEVPTTMEYFENVTLRSVESSQVEATFMIHTPIQLRPLKDKITAIEDEEYKISYWNFGYKQETWNVVYDSEWLKWSEENKTLYGTPRNNHVYPCKVKIEIKDEKGHKDVHEFQIIVENSPPKITTENVLYAKEGEEYSVDYNSSDDGQGEITWEVIPDNSWFSIEKYTGILSGTPYYDDAGTMNIIVIVHDDHGGMNSTSFMLTIIDVNQPPLITTSDVTMGKQGEPYYRDYEVLDLDEDTNFFWELYTDASFLRIDNLTGELSGTPGPFDVGTWSVNVTVKDSGGLKCSHEFILMIENVNDKPNWVDLPEDIELLHGTLFRFDVNASDPDVGDEIEYSIWTDPESDMKINKRTGIIEWVADYTIFDGDDNEMEVNLKAQDAGGMFSTYAYVITVKPTRSPTASLLDPCDGARTSFKNTELRWTGTDPEGERLTYWIYIYDKKSFVEMGKEEALYTEDYEGTLLDISTLEKGKTYYWTVIPFDQCTFGSCCDGIREVRINSPPQLPSIPAQKAKTEEEFSLKVMGSDSDPEDYVNLAYSIVDGPEGLVIHDTTGTIKWKPRDDQVGDHRVIVSLSDGIDENEVSFNIVVTEAEAENDGSIVLIAGMTVLMILFMIIIILQIRILTRKGEDRGKDRRKVAKEIQDTVKETADELEKIEFESSEEGASEKTSLDVSTSKVEEKEEIPEKE